MSKIDGPYGVSEHERARLWKITYKVMPDGLGPQPDMVVATVVVRELAYRIAILLNAHEAIRDA